MNFFEFYLQLGFQHLLDINGFDHWLFLMVLCAVYKVSEWKKVILLATAFTIGHSLTLGLASFDIIRFSLKVVEVLIPATILLTAIYNLLLHFKGKKNDDFTKIVYKYGFNYVLAAIFGLIHGMAFSNDLRSMLMSGEENKLFQQLLAFNLGVELGQFLLISGILFATWFVLDVLKLPAKYWVSSISGLAIIAAVLMILERCLLLDIFTI